MLNTPDKKWLKTYWFGHTMADAQKREEASLEIIAYASTFKMLTNEIVKAHQEIEMAISYHPSNQQEADASKPHPNPFAVMTGVGDILEALKNTFTEKAHTLNYIARIPSEQAIKMSKRSLPDPVTLELRSVAEKYVTQGTLKKKLKSMSDYFLSQNKVVTWVRKTDEAMQTGSNATFRFVTQCQEITGSNALPEQKIDDLFKLYVAYAEETHSILEKIGSGLTIDETDLQTWLKLIKDNPSSLGPKTSQQINMITKTARLLVSHNELPQFISDLLVLHNEHGKMIREAIIQLYKSLNEYITFYKNTKPSVEAIKQKLSTQESDTNPFISLRDRFKELLTRSMETMTSIKQYFVLPEAGDHEAKQTVQSKIREIMTSLLRLAHKIKNTCIGTELDVLTPIWYDFKAIPELASKMPPIEMAAQEGGTKAGAPEFTYQ